MYFFPFQTKSPLQTHMVNTKLVSHNLTNYKYDHQIFCFPYPSHKAQQFFPFLSLASNKYYKLDVKGYENEELKGQGRRPSQPQLKSLEDIIFQFPFEWTLQSNNFKYYDPRFTEQPLKKSLQNSEKQHILYVLQNFQGLINSNTLSAPQNQLPKQFNKNYTQQTLKKYLHTCLSSKLPSFIQSLKASQLSIKLHILKDSVSKSEGYMEMQTKNVNETDLINFLSPKFIHQYEFTKEKELLLVEEKKKKGKKSQENMLQEDVKEMMDTKSGKKEVREFFDEMKKQKVSQHQKAAQYLQNKLKNLLNKKPEKKKQQESYVTSQLIKGKVHFKIFYKNSLICDDETELHSKWMYVVEKNEPQSVRKSRKRVLYDFQFWNRGSFFQVKDWVKDIEA